MVLSPLMLLFQPAIKRDRDINYLMICLLALPPRERLLKVAVWCWSHIFTWKHFLFESVAALELGIAS
jgi:hypothetical protein